MLPLTHVLHLVHGRVTEDIENENQGILVWKSLPLSPGNSSGLSSTEPDVKLWKLIHGTEV